MRYSTYLPIGEVHENICNQQAMNGRLYRRKRNEKRTLGQQLRRRSSESRCHLKSGEDLFQMQGQKEFCLKRQMKGAEKTRRSVRGHAAGGRGGVAVSKLRGLISVFLLLLLLGAMDLPPKPQKELDESLVLKCISNTYQGDVAVAGEAFHLTSTYHRSFRKTRRKLYTSKSSQ